MFDTPYPAHALIARVNRAIEHMRRGEGDQAGALLKPLRADATISGEIALVAGEICIDLHMLDEAAAFLERAIAMDPDNPNVRIAHAECGLIGQREETWRRAGRELRGRLECLQERAQSRRTDPGAQQVHIVCKLDTIGGTERRALNLYRCLSGRMPVTLWSNVPAAASIAANVPVRLIGADGVADNVPEGGTLVLVGTYFDCAGWLESSAFERVVICHNLTEQHATLGRFLARLETNASRPRVELVFPSNFFRELTGLPGAVEYSPVDTQAFRPRRPAPTARKRLSVGRHGRAYAYKFHPNDPAFFRRLLALGYDVRILGGSIIAPAFEGDAVKPILFDVGALGAPEFLDGLDVFLYRRHPQWVETGGTVILEAMAMELPAVVFAGNCGYTEVIVDGENGFLVHDETQAAACIDRLRDDPALCERVGRAARATIVDLMRRQEADCVRFYR